MVYNVHMFTWGASLNSSLPVPFCFCFGHYCWFAQPLPHVQLVLLFVFKTTLNKHKRKTIKYTAAAVSKLPCQDWYEAFMFAFKIPAILFIRKLDTFNLSVNSEQYSKVVKW